jgi:hypothetical protein
MGDSGADPKGDGATGHPAAKKPYEKPAISWEEQLETRPGLTAGCSKIAGQSFECDGNRAS